MELLQKGEQKAFYGLDVPAMIRDCIALGEFCLFRGWCCVSGLKGGRSTLRPLCLLLGGAMVLIGGLSIVEGLSIVWGSLVGKWWERDHLFDQIQLQGNEHVLDVGCGCGLVLVGAAKRLPRGRAVGIDLWSQVDQGSNSKEAALKNVRIEGVEVHNGDIHTMLFADASFDLIVANLAVHNIESPEGRAQAAREIRRVLKPGGKIAIY